MKKHEGIEGANEAGNGLASDENSGETGHTESIGNEEIERVFPKRKYAILIGNKELVNRMTTAEAACMLEASSGTAAFLELDGRRFELKRDPFSV